MEDLPDPLHTAAPAARPSTARHGSPTVFGRLIDPQEPPGAAGRIVRKPLLASRRAMVDQYKEAKAREFHNVHEENRYLRDHVRDQDKIIAILKEELARLQRELARKAREAEVLRARCLAAESQHSDAHRSARDIEDRLTEHRAAMADRERAAADAKADAERSAAAAAMLEATVAELRAQVAAKVADSEKATVVGAEAEGRGAAAAARCLTAERENARLRRRLRRALVDGDPGEWSTDSSDDQAAVPGADAAHSARSGATMGHWAKLKEAAAAARQQRLAHRIEAAERDRQRQQEVDALRAEAVALRSDAEAKAQAARDADTQASQLKARLESLEHQSASAATAAADRGSEALRVELLAARTATQVSPDAAGLGAARAELEERVAAAEARAVAEAALRERTIADAERHTANADTLVAQLRARVEAATAAVATAEGHAALQELAAAEHEARHGITMRALAAVGSLAGGFAADLSAEVADLAAQRSSAQRRAAVLSDRLAAADAEPHASPLPAPTPSSPAALDAAAVAAERDGLVAQVREAKAEAAAMAAKLQRAEATVDALREVNATLQRTLQAPAPMAGTLAASPSTGTETAAVLAELRHQFAALAQTVGQGVGGPLRDATVPAAELRQVERDLAAARTEAATHRAALEAARSERDAARVDLAELRRQRDLDRTAPPAQVPAFVAPQPMPASAADPALHAGLRQAQADIAQLQTQQSQRPRDPAADPSLLEDLRGQLRRAEADIAERDAVIARHRTGAEAPEAARLSALLQDALTGLTDAKAEAAVLRDQLAAAQWQVVSLEAAAVAATETPHRAVPPLALGRRASSVAKADLEEAVATLGQLRQQLSDARRDKDAADARAVAAEASAAAASATVAPLREQIAALQATAAAEAAARSGATATHDGLAREAALAAEVKAAVLQEAATLRAQLHTQETLQADRDAARDELARSKAASQEALERCAKDLATAEEQRARAEAQLQALREATASGPNAETLAAELAAAASQRDAAREDHRRAVDETQALVAEVRRLEREVAASAEAKESADVALAAAEQGQAAAEAQLEAAQATRATEAEELQAAVEERDTAQRQVQQLAQQAEEAAATIERLKQDAEAHAAAAAEATGDKAKATAWWDAERKRLTDQARVAEADKHVAEQAVALKTKELAKATATNARLKSAVHEALEAARRELRQEEEGLRQHIALLERQLEAERVGTAAAINDAAVARASAEEAQGTLQQLRLAQMHW